MTPAPAVDAAIARILEDEGGVQDVGDGKGVTRYGQTQLWLDDNGFVPPTSVADAAMNYATWMERTRLADLCARDALVGYLVTDWAVHSPLAVAISGLQRAAGVAVDGVLGPVTLEAVTPAMAAAIARRVLALRLEFIGGLLGSTKVDRRPWAHGWCRRLARQVARLP